MILIEERKTNKLPGKSSLFIKFKYNEAVLSKIKECLVANFDKKTSEWEIPVTSLSKFVNEVYLIDDIAIKTLLEDELKQELIYCDESNFKTKPYKYLLDGINYGLNHDKWLLLDAPGLGKTLQIIYLAQERKRLEGIHHCLIICGINALKSNWVKEIEKHSNLSARILGQRVNKKGNIVIGSIKDRLEQLKNPIEEFFVIVNIETIRDDNIVKYINAGPNKFEMMAFDEVHTAKSTQSLQGKNTIKLKAKYKIAMTGTLILNNPLDSYMPLKFIEKENGTYTNFKFYYCSFTGPFNNILLGYKNTRVLKDQIESCSLRRTKDLLDLPEKTIINELIDMNDKLQEFYDNIKEGIVNQVDLVNITTTSLLAMVTRFRLATECPWYLTSEEIESSKISRACDLVDQAVLNGSKVVVFSTFTDSAKMMFSKLLQYNPLLCIGETSDQEISLNVDKFLQEDTNKVIVATWLKMGTGITLTAADTMIFLSTPWTRGVFDLACDRIHRIGSKKPVFIYNLICKNTLDERVLQLITDKGAISDYMIDNQISNNTINSLKKYIEDLK